MNITSIGCIAFGLIAAVSIIACTIVAFQRDEARAQLASCQTELNEQNNATKAANAQQKTIQSAVNTAEITNTQIDASLIREKKTIASAPNLTDCEKATQWGAKQASIAASRFQ